MIDLIGKNLAVEQQIMYEKLNELTTTMPVRIEQQQHATVEIYRRTLGEQIMSLGFYAWAGVLRTACKTGLMLVQQSRGPVSNDVQRAVDLINAFKNEFVKNEGNWYVNRRVEVVGDVAKGFFHCLMNLVHNFEALQPMIESELNELYDARMFDYLYSQHTGNVIINRMSMDTFKKCCGEVLEFCKNNPTGFVIC